MNLPAQTVKFLVKLFSKSLQGIKGGGAPFCSAPRAAQCANAKQIKSAQQKKTVPAKNSEANFWRLRFTRPLRAGKRANANFACSEGFFLSGAPRRLPGLAAFSKPAAVWPIGFCAWCFGVFSVGVPLPCSRPVGCPPFFVWPALPACRLAVVGFVSGLAGSLPLLCKLLRPLPCLPAVRFVCAFSSCFGCLFARSVLCARLFSLIFRLFLPNFFLSNLFSFVAQAATGPSLACPLPRLCSRPAGLVICCFFAGFCAHCLFACSALFMRVFSLLFFHLFLPNFFLSKLFSFVAQAATGISLLVPSRGFVSGLRVLSPAAFSRTFAPIACLPVLRCLCGFSLSCFFALSCLTSFSQTSFHLSLRPRREFPCLSPPAALFPACAPLFCRLYADFCACLSGLRCRCLPCALCAQFHLVLAVCLPVLRCLCGFSLSCFLPFPA